MLQEAIKMYFECNISKRIPQFYHPHIYRKLTETVKLVHDRTDKLNNALSLCSLVGCSTREATFARIAKVIFDFSDSKFDAMTAEQLSHAVDLLYDGPNAEVVFDTAFVTTKDWEALRHIGIGGSDSSVVMGLSPYQTEEGLWYEKTGYPEYIQEEDKNAIFARGHFIEPVVIRTFADLVGAEVIPETRMFRSRKYPNTTANIDGILRMPSGSLAIFEAKTAVRGKEGEWMGRRVPANYVCQCHQYMAVLDDPRIEGTYIGMIPVADVILDGTYIGSAYNDDFFHHFIEPDPIYQEEMMEAEKLFWDMFIVNGIKPERSRNVKLDKAVAIRYKPSPFSDPAIPSAELAYEDWKNKLDMLVESDKAYSQAKKQLDQMEVARENARLEVLDALQGAQQGIFRNDSGEIRMTVKNSLVTKTTPDAKKLKEFYPEAWEAVKTTSSYTKFSYKAS